MTKMKKITVAELSAEEKLRLLCCDGWWKTFDFDGKLPSVEVSDGPVGLRKGRTDEKGETTCPKSVYYSSIQTLANTWNERLAEQMGECLADDCKAERIDILLAPGVNIKRHPLNGRNFEYFSEDPLLAGRMAKSYIIGLQSQGIGACLKHFCCNNLEYNRFEQSSEVDERTLREIYYLPFEIACEAKPVSVMSAYNRVNGRYASENAKGFKVLREEFGFDGAIYSDWEAVRDRTASAKAGLDIEFPYNDNNYKKLLKDYENGKITESQIDACAERVLNMVYRCKQMRQGKGVKRTVEERLEVARKIAEEGMVLLKNEGGILPLKKRAKAAIFGCFAKPERGMLAGEGSSLVNPVTENQDLVQLLEEELGVKIPFETMYYYDRVLGTNGYAHYAAKPMNGRNNAAAADVSIICAGTGSFIESEAFDRKDMRLPEAQEKAICDLAEINPNTVVVLFAGSPVDVSAWEHKVKAIVYAGFCGERGIQALCGLICGKVNFSGKLTESFPANYEASPVARGYIDTAVTRYGEGLDVGYRYYDRHPEGVKYPFGFGLSYSEFRYGDLKITVNGMDAEVGFWVENTSEKDGKEVVQVYVSELSPAVYRPVKELKGYAKPEIKSGEKKRVIIKLNERSFAYYSVADDCWRVNDGAYRISVGSSSRDIRLSAVIKIENGKIV